MLETSEKTVKKALDNLAGEGYVTFMRGRYGGTFVTDIPVNEGYTWIAISSDYIRRAENQSKILENWNKYDIINYVNNHKENSHS